MDESADEKPKAEIAKQVITPKRKYFFPQRGVEVEAVTAELAVEALKSTNTEDEKVGDVK